MNNQTKLKDNMKLFKILLKLNLLSFNIILNLALILGLNIENKNKDLIITEMMNYLKDQNDNDLDNFNNLLEDNVPSNDINKLCSLLKVDSSVGGIIPFSEFFINDIQNKKI